MFVVTSKELSNATRYKLKENVRSKHIMCVKVILGVCACLTTNFKLPKN